MNKFRSRLSGVLQLLAWSAILCGAFDRPTRAAELLTLSGATPQVAFIDNVGGAGNTTSWQIIAQKNGVNDGFTVRDLTSGASIVPFRLDLGLPTDALRVTKDNTNSVNVGIGGVAENQKHLHIRGKIAGVSAPITIRMENTLAGSEQIWDIVASKSFFGIQDSSLVGPPTPFLIQKGAPSSTLFISSAGNVGIGSAPLRTLHLRETVQTPTLRFQDASAMPQTWDVEADHLGFDLVNEPGTAFETRPFTVLPDAPTASLFVATNGSIGMGTGQPQVIVNTAAAGRLVNVRSDTSNSRFVLQGGAGGLMELVDLSAGPDEKIFRIFSRSGFTRFQVVDDDLQALAINNVMAIDMGNGHLGLQVASPAFPLHLASGAHVTVGGVFTDASSRDLKQDIEPLTSAQARATVRALQPVGYRYKNQLDERYVGFIAEDVPELVATRDRKSLAPMDITAVLTKVVQDQERAIERLEQTNAELIRRLEALERKVNAE